MRQSASLLAGLTLLLGCPVALAQQGTLRVDVLVFTQPDTLSNPPAADWMVRGPDQADALSLEDARGLQVRGVTLLSEKTHSLLREWRVLNKAPGYGGVHLLSYTQTGAGAPVRIYMPGADPTVEGLEGTIRVNSGKVPKLEVALLQRAPGQLQPVAFIRQTAETNGKVQYLDGGRLGMLIRVGTVESFNPAPVTVGSTAATPAANAAARSSATGVTKAAPKPTSSVPTPTR